MATLEVAALLSPTASTASSAGGGGNWRGGGWIHRNAFLSQPVVYRPALEPSADVVTPGLAALNAGRWRALPADPALPAAYANPSNPSVPTQPILTCNRPLRR